MPPRKTPDFTDEQLAAVAAWIAANENDFSSPFRKRIGTLQRALNMPLRVVYAILRRQRPDLWTSINRLRQMWFDRRDTLIANGRASGVMCKDVAARLGITLDAHWRASKQINRKVGRVDRNIVLTDKVERLFMWFEEELEALREAPGLPQRALPLMRALAEKLGLTSSDARRALEYHRPDLYRTYTQTNDIYLSAVFKEIRSNGATPADIEDLFDLPRSTACSVYRRYFREQGRKA